MNKTNLIKVISILLISAMVVTFANVVFAATEDDYPDLTNKTNNTNTSNNASKNNTNSNTNKSNTNSNSNSNTNKTNNTNLVNNTNKNNASMYNNTSLPKTGIADSVPAVVLIVIFGISSVYALKKINEYKNI